MVNQPARFLEGSLIRHIAVMSFTASIGLMAVFVVDLVDMIFISMLGRDELAAAVGYAGAILFFTSSFGIGMSIAAGAVVARALGEGEADVARRRAATAMLYGVGLGAVFAAVVWLNTPALARMMGAQGVTLDLATGYLRIILPSLPLLIIGMVGSAILRAHGDARRSMMATLAGGTVNAVLDPILIFGFGLDLTGAAFASVTARVAIGLTALYPIFRFHGGLARPTKDEFRIDFPAIMTIALPAILTQFATPIGQAFVTRSMSAFGEDAVAGMAVIGRLVPVAFATVFALSGAIGPIIGQNYGARQHDRVSGALRDGLIFIAVVVVCVSLVLFLARGAIADLFDATGLTRSLIFLFCGPLALAWYFNGAIFVANATFNNLGRPFYSTWINWGRHTLGTIPPVLAGATLWGAHGVLIGQAAGGVFFAVLAVYLARRVIRGSVGTTPKPVNPYARQTRLLQLFNFRR